MHRIAIIGAGFSGSATAIQLLRRAAPEPVTITLINRHPELARGVAYGTHSPSHLLNVPAGRMSLFPDVEGDFLRYAQGLDPEATGGSFMPRSLYGEYLAARLQEAAAQSSAKLETLTAEVTDLRLASDGSHALLSLGDGTSLKAERVVLASGNYPPGDPRLPDMAFYQSPRYIRDPWAPGAFEQLDSKAPVLLIGTGLTMMDVALELHRRGFEPHLFALSRRGLMPQPHREHTGPALEPAVVMELLRQGPAAIRRWFRVLRLCIAELQEQGIDWRDVLGALRPFTPELWQSLNHDERRRFLRHLQPYWDTHRHRTAPMAYALLQSLVRDGSLTVKAGRLTALLAAGDRVQLRWRPRGTAQEARTTVGTVINCTGPQAHLQKSADPLIRSLLRQGLLVQDALALGLQTDAVGALKDANGRAAHALFYTGPLLKARDWECTAVPELRVAALKLAEHLADSLRAVQVRTSVG